MRAWFLTTALVAAKTVQAEPPVWISLDYEATPGCPEGAWFTGRVRARTNRVAFEPGAGPLALIRVDGEALEGSLGLTGPGLEPLVRKASGKTCEEVVDALALILAMALDPTVTPASAAPAAPTVQSPPLAPPGVESPGGAVVPPAQTAPVAPLASAAPPAGPPPTLTPRRALPGRFMVDVGAGPALAEGMAPRLSAGAFLFLEVSARGPGPWSPAGVFALEFDHSATSHTHQLPRGDASFSRIVGRVEGCPLRLLPWSTLVFRPCVAFEYGMLEGKGSHIVKPLVRRDQWIAPALGLRGEWRPHSSVLLVLDGLVGWPLVQDRFYFAPNTTVHRVKAPAIGVTLGVGASFR